MDKKVIFIDWHGTLSDSIFWEHLDQNTYRIIDNCIFNKERHLIYPWMRGDYSAEDICTVISKNSDLSPRFLMQELKQSCENMKINGTVISQVKKLRVLGFKVYIATDNMDTFNRWTVPSLNLLGHFDGVLNSFNLKALKGDFDDKGSKFFRSFLAENTLGPQDCVLIDDGEDREGVLNSYGIEYIKLNSSSELISILNNYV